MIRPPAAAERLLAVLLPDAETREAVLGDLHEEHDARAQGSPWRARAWYWREAAALSARFAPQAAGRALRARNHRRREGSMGRWAGDVRFGLRSLLKRPGTSLLLVATLAVALAANATIYSVFDALLVRPMDYPNQARLVRLWETSPSTEPYDRSTVAPANFLDWREQTRGVFQDLIALEWWDATLRSGDVPERVVGARVSAGFFDALGVAMTLGRGFRPGDDAPGREKQVVLGHDLWKRSFAADPAVVGTTVMIGGEAYTVVGVGPRGFHFPEGADVWAPYVLPGDAARDQHYLTAYGLLAPGRTLAEAGAALDVVTARLQREHPQTNAQRATVVMPLARGSEDVALRPILAVWQAAAVFVLLIACVNVANLVLARASERRREIAVRIALGARSRDLVQQLVVEGLLVAAGATLLSLPLTQAATQALRRSLPAQMARAVPGWDGIDVDLRLVLATAVVAALAATLFSTLPALRSSHVPLTVALREGGRSGSGGRRRQRGRNVLVTAQIAAALMLLACAGITASGALRMLDGPQGYDPDGLLAFEVALPAKPYAEAESRRTFARRALERVSALPGVGEAAYTNVLPARGDNTTRRVLVEGAPVRDAGDPVTSDARAVSPGYFHTMRIPITSGRGFDENDRADGAPVAIVSRAMAARDWPGQDPLGRRFKAGGDDAPWLTVVGVSGDVIHHWFTRRNHPTFYRPYVQDPRQDVAFALRTAGDPAALALSARRAIRDVAPEQPVHDLATMRQAMHDSTIGLQFVAAIMAAFGALGLILAVSGVYGVMAYRVSLRTLEIGVRVALGATRADVLRTTLGQAARLTAIGLGAGTLMAMALVRATAFALQGAVGLDGRQLAAAIAALGAAALLAAYVPARRALAIDPARALRDE